MDILKNTTRLIEIIDNKIFEWHKSDPEIIPLEILPIRRNFSEFEDIFLKKSLEILEANYNLWHLEDLARDKNASDSIIANVKRKIDKENQLRNDRIEQLDILIDNFLNENGIVSKTEISNSETPGSIVDRLTILSLKIYHMKEQTLRDDVPEEHILSCKRKKGILVIQRNDLSRALSQLIDDILKGKKKHKIYYQFKMYNDPDLNPVLYKNG